MKLTAVLMLCAYIAGVSGFDVHSCRASGKDYVVAAISGMTGLECEDIHPDSQGHHCHHSHGCHSRCNCLPHSNEGHEKVDENNCCSNTYHALTLSGSGDVQRPGLVCFPVLLSPHIHCCLCCRDCRMASTGMMADLGLLDGVPIAGYSFIGKLFSVFRI
ncbi:MAG: hypothetical protein ACI39U_04665 [Candidatus Cryptobacteroides sp.]